MDKKKALLIVLLAALLAFVIAYLIKPREEKELPEIKQSTIEQVETSSIEETPQEDESTELLKETNKSPVLTEVKEVKKSNVVSKSEKVQPVFDKLEVKEEISKIEEASVYFEDPGIINENGTIVVTRDFKIKSPRKYSFKDFGVLATPPVK